jgi:3-deoxy-manno-octulosonate cytidylyltransferase (CMP-KDO synthetase)
MQLLNGKSVILTTYESTVDTELFDEVAVICDSPVIYNEITSNGGKAIMSQQEHECGTDRIAEALPHFPDASIIVNVQGDEPFTQKEPMQKLLQVFEGEDGKDIGVASLMQVLKEEASIRDANYVKVAVDLKMNALFFPVPLFHTREKRI